MNLRRRIQSVVPQGSYPAVANAALLLLGLLLLAFCGQGVREIHHFFIGFSMVALCQSLIYLAAVWVVLNNPVNRWTFLIILFFALACRLVCLFSPPFLSTDIYRYVWDGRVQGAGINPYRYIPADAHLAFLRDQAIYPSINRRTYAHTVYPPGAQVLFLLITRIGQSVVFMKAAMVVLEGLTIWPLVELLAAFGLRREQVLIYAWHPLLFWEVASSGHVDAAALPFIALAFLFYVQRKPTLTGLALAAATLVKLYPIVLFPMLYRRRDWKMPVCLTAVVAASYACYLSVGAQVFGFLPEYAKEEGMESGARYFLLTLGRHLLHREDLPTALFMVFAGILMGAVALWAWRRKDAHPMAPVRFGFAIAALMMLLFSPHYPWYYLWLLPLLCVVPYVPMLYFTVASFYLYTTSLANPGPRMYYMFEWLYGTFALLAVGCLGVQLLKLRSARNALATQEKLSLDPISARKS